MSAPVKLSARFWSLTPAEFRALVAAQPNAWHAILEADEATLARELDRATAADLQPAAELEADTDPVDAAAALTALPRQAMLSLPGMARASLVAEWLAAGGCKHCDGRGWVVTWDTMDSMSGGYAEYGVCPAETRDTEYRMRFSVAPGADCTVASRAVSGLAPTHTMYDRNRGVPDILERAPEADADHPNERAMRDRFQSFVGRFRTWDSQVLAEYDAARERHAIRKGRTVVVFKGRKVPVGTMGVVIWTGEGQYGPRVGVKDAAGHVWWTAADNCRVLPEVPEVKVRNERPARAGGGR